MILNLSVAADSAAATAAGTLELIRVSNATQSWLGVEASDLSFGLNFAPVSLAVTNGELKLNQATGADRVDWSAISIDLDSDPATAAFNVDVNADVDLSVSGDAAISFDDLLTVDGSFTLVQQDADAGNVTGAPAEFAGAKALILNLSVAADSAAATAAGTLELIRVSNATQSWLGV
ncbi:MAG: hypothetical protein GY914_09265, partial [Prochlorococcus sp.]|nr:hypothetical protein [Prochlorococcus sp.]